MKLLYVITIPLLKIDYQLIRFFEPYIFQRIYLYSVAAYNSCMKQPLLYQLRIENNVLCLMACKGN